MKSRKKRAVAAVALFCLLAGAVVGQTDETADIVREFADVFDAAYSKTDYYMQQAAGMQDYVLEHIPDELPEYAYTPYDSESTVRLLKHLRLERDAYKLMDDAAVRLRLTATHFKILYEQYQSYGATDDASLKQDYDETVVVMLRALHQLDDAISLANDIISLCNEMRAETRRMFGMVD
jgi:hypothetical protein